jgi:hypothetical protein
VASPQSQSLRIAARPGQAPPGKHQQRFNTLIKKVAQLKHAIHVWSQATPDLHRRVAEYHHQLAAHRATISDLVRLLDRMSADRSLTKRETVTLRQVICDLACDVLEDGASDDIKAIYNKHSRGDYDAETATESAMQARMMKTVLQHDFGMDFGDAEISSLEDLQRAAHEKIDAAEREAEQHRQTAEARKAKRKKSARQLASEARRATETAQIGKTLQDVYRKLAILLHPDREQDPAERARKTLLMQEVNAAYERKDLLLLLELRLRFEQVDESQIGSIAEDRLIQFNTLLAEQVRQLQQELAAVEEPWRLSLDCPPSGKLTPARVDAALRHDLRQLAGNHAHARRDLAQLSDLRRLKAWLRAAHAEEAAEAARAERAARDPFAAWFGRD